MDGCCTLFAMPRGDRSLDVRKYADEAMNRLVTARVAESTDWRAVVDRGLREAKAQSDIPGFVLMVQLICQILEGDGRLEDGLAEVDHALDFASNSADIGAILNGLKASMQAAMGRPDDAKRTLAKGLAALPRASTEAGVRYRVFRKVALWQSFEDETGEPATALVKACAELGLERDRAFLVSWYVPWLANIGDRRTAHPIIRDLRQEAADAH